MKSTYLAIVILSIQRNGLERLFSCFREHITKSATNTWENRLWIHCPQGTKGSILAYEYGPKQQKQFDLFFDKMEGRSKKIPKQIITFVRIAGRGSCCKADMWVTNLAWLSSFNLSAIDNMERIVISFILLLVSLFDQLLYKEIRETSTDLVKNGIIQILLGELIDICIDILNPFNLWSYRHTSNNNTRVARSLREKRLNTQGEINLLYDSMNTQGNVLELFLIHAFADIENQGQHIRS